MRTTRVSRSVCRHRPLAAPVRRTPAPTTVLRCDMITNMDIYESKHIVLSETYVRMVSPVSDSQCGAVVEEEAAAVGGGANGCHPFFFCFVILYEECECAS